MSVFPINSRPFGHTYGEWSAKWWQWLLSIPKRLNPALDPTGANANSNQNHANVFFLCQTYEEGKPAIPSRTVTVPCSKSIFMPIINWISLLHVDGETDKELIETAKNRMDVVANLQITINGLTVKDGLEQYRAQSPLFEISVPEDNILSLPAGIRRAVSDGYWLFLRSLNTDSKISSFGSCSSGFTRIGVNYNIYAKRQATFMA